MKLHAIQMLRGIAALAVALLHLGAIETEVLAGREQGLLSGWTANGYAGVDLFFVISGFIMVYVTAGRARGAASAGDFLVARAARIYPLWWLFAGLFALFMLASYGVPYPPDVQAASGESGAGYTIKSFLLIPQGAYPLLGVGWTLIHEMYFYLVFAVFLLAPKRWLPWLMAVWAVFVIGNDLMGQTYKDAADLLTLANHTMTLEFIGGGFAAMLVLSGRRSLAAPVTLIAGAALLIALAVYTNDNTYETMRWGRVLWFGGPAIALVYGLTSLELGGRLKTVKPLVILGDISYALYLSHILSFALMKRVFAGWLGAPGWLDNLVFFIVSLAFALLVSIAAHRLFETPSLTLLSKWRRAWLGPVERAAG